MNRNLLQWLDLPPVWLGLFAALGWVVGQLVPFGLPSGRWIGGGLVLAGLLLMSAAVLQMLRLRTTFVPRRDPRALATGGVFRFSRNPIYLADALVLAGLLISWQALWAAPLVPAFMVFITHRFILGEEARIAARFGTEWQAYAARTRRWI